MTDFKHCREAGLEVIAIIERQIEATERPATHALAEHRRKLDIKEAP